MSSLVSLLEIDVPYGKKAIESKLNIIPKSNNSVEFVLTTKNKGTLAIGGVHAKIEIYDSKNEFVTFVKTQTVKIALNQDINLRAMWNNIAKKGNYYAVTKLVYDGKISSFRKTFKVGEPFIEILNVSVDDFKLGKLARIRLVLESDWNDLINDFSVKAKILDEDNHTVGTYDTEKLKIKPDTKEITNLYWDTKGLSKGKYRLLLEMKHSGKIQKYESPLDVKSDRILTKFTGFTISDDEKGRSWLSFVIAFVLIMVVAGLVSLFFMKYRYKPWNLKGKMSKTFNSIKKKFKNGRQELMVPDKVFSSPEKEKSNTEFDTIDERIKELRKIHKEIIQSSQTHQKKSGRGGLNGM